MQLTRRAPILSANSSPGGTPAVSVAMHTEVGALFSGARQVKVAQIGLSTSLLRPAKALDVYARKDPEVKEILTEH